MHTAPRWYVEITPRLGVLAGFEQATGVFVNTIPPERAVEFPHGRRRMSVTVTVCTTIDAPPAAVWAAVENIESHTDWMKDAVRITFKSDAAQRSRGRVRVPHARRAALHDRPSSSSRMWRPGEMMGIEHRGAVTGDAEFRLEPDGDERTRFCWEERLRFPWWLGGFVGERVGMPVLRHLWSGNVARLKASIEDAR